MSNYPAGVSSLDFEEKEFYGTVELSIDLSLLGKNRIEAEQILANSAYELKNFLINYNTSILDVNITNEKLD